MTVLDQTADVAWTQLNRFARLYAFPEHVKQASVSDATAPPRDVPSTLFADVRTRQFPCHTKAACWLSYLYFLEHRPQLPAKIAEWTEQRLERFANSYGIAGEIEALKEKHASLNRNFLSDNDYLIVLSGPHGVKQAEYPLRNAREVKTAADWFLRYRDHFEYDDRRTMSVKLLEKANQFGVSLSTEADEALEQQVGRGTYCPKTAAEHIRNRVKSADRKQLQRALLPFGRSAADLLTELEKSAAVVERTPHLATCPATIQNLCRTLDHFDRLTKLAGHYTDMLPRPEAVFCETTYKTAQAAVDESIQLTTGNIYRREDVVKLALSEIRGVLGDDLAEAMSIGLMLDPEKLAEVAPTLPRPDAALLDSVMAEHGVRPLRKAAQAVRRPSHAELLQLRERHLSLQAR